MIRKFIASLLFYSIVHPVGWLIDKLYPEGTQHPLRVWFNEKQGKVRFLFGFVMEVDLDTAGVGMKIADWKNVSREIDRQIREYENIQQNKRNGIV